MQHLLSRRIVVSTSVKLLGDGKDGNTYHDPLHRAIPSMLKPDGMTLPGAYLESVSELWDHKAPQASSKI